MWLRGYQSLTLDFHEVETYIEKNFHFTIVISVEFQVGTDQFNQKKIHFNGEDPNDACHKFVV